MSRNFASVSLSFLYRSYGLAATPRVRFLKRIANKHQNLHVDTSRKQEGEKSAEELMEMIVSSAKAKKEAVRMVMSCSIYLSYC